jgi:lipopolysaccharide heptosyltransferase II
VTRKDSWRRSGSANALVPERFMTMTAKVRRLWRSICGLVQALARELGAAAACALTGRPGESAEHVRFALLALHDDLATLAAARWYGVALPSSDRVDKILIVKLDRIGDMVNTTPMFELLSKRYPGARLDIVGHPTVLTLLEADPRVGKRIPYTSVLYHGGALRLPGVAAWRLVRTLCKTSYPIVVYLRGSFPFLALAARGRFLAAKFVEGEPVIRRYLKALDADTEHGSLLPVPSLHVSVASRARVLAKYPGWAAGPSVVIHAMSAAAGKQWPLERFARIADEIAVRAQARVLFLATPAEREKIARIQALCKRQHDFETEFQIPEVVCAIAHADVFVGNDSGLAHIAAGVQTREVIVWGAANLEMARPAARSGFCTVLYRDVTCRARCPEIRCIGPVHLKCLLDIVESEVVAAALDHLRSARIPGRE